jgi:hypothetical protein
MRKTNARPLARRPDGVFVAPFEQVGSGLTCFAPPATWGWRAWCRNSGIDRIRLGGRALG